MRPLDLPREVVDASSLEAFKGQAGWDPRQPNLTMAGIWEQMIFKVPSNIRHPMDLYIK